MQCPNCKKTIGPTEPTYLVSVGYGDYWMRKVGGAIAFFCAECADKTRGWQGASAWHEPLPCVHCQRTVFHDAARRIPKHVVCSKECRQAVYYAVVRARRRRPKRDCSTCAEPFQPKRTDALYCSSACRQRAYRLRRDRADRFVYKPGDVIITTRDR